MVSDDRVRLSRRLTSACAAFLVAVASAVGVIPAAGEGGRIIDHLYATYFINHDQGFAVGAFGSIFRTRDGAQTWQAQSSGTVEQLFGVGFADTSNGWIVGRTGVMLHTGNGGDTWERQTTGSDKHLFNVAALDAQHAWAVGDWGAILATDDGGKTWKDHTLDRDVILYGQAWVSATQGWVVGELGAIVHTVDGGKTWQDQPSGVEKTLFDVHFNDAQHGWACGLDGLILKTDDGGQHWSVLRGKAEVNALEQVGVAEALENASLYGISVHGQIGFAVGDIGSVFLTKDGGQTWVRQEVPGEWNLSWIRGMSLAPDGSGMFVGANGLTIRVDGEHLKGPGKS